MEVRIKDKEGYVDADWTIEDGVMVVSPKEVKFEPKDGDVVIVTTETGGNYTCFFKGCVNGDVYSYGGLNNLYNMLFEIGLVCCSKRLKTIYPATEEEKKKLFEKLAEEGFEWKPDTKELIKLKWKPMAGQRYYIPDICNAQFKAVIEDWSDDALDVLYFGKGWAFRTEEECQELCNRLNDAINSVKP